MLSLRLVRNVAILSFSLVSLASAAAGEWEFPKEWFWHQDDQQRARHAELLGKPMPALELSDWKNGELTPADMKGKILVLDFWATWCGPCIAAIPHNNELQAKYKDKGVEVIGICTAKKGQEKYAQMVESTGIKYPSARDPKLVSEKAWRVMWYPTYAVVDRAGKVRAIGLQPDHVEDVVKKLLEEKGTAQANEPAADGAQLASSAAGASQIDPAWLEGKRERFANLEGAAPPPLAVSNWTNSPQMSLEQLKGRVVVLDFWATWCGPCIASIPHTNELMEKYGDEGLVIIGVCHPRGAEKMQQTVKEKGIKYPVAADASGKTIEAYQVDGYPDYFLIDRAGKLRIADCKNGNVEDAIKALLAEPGLKAAQ